MKYYKFENPLIIVDKYGKKPFIIEMLSMPDYNSILSEAISAAGLHLVDKYSSIC